MTQDQWAVLLFRIAMIASLASLLQWIAVYSVLERWWKHQVGWSLVAKTLLICGQLSLFILALFFRLNRLDSRVVLWLYVFFTAAVTPVMLWRSVLWARLSKTGGTGRAGHRDLAGHPGYDETAPAPERTTQMTAVPRALHPALNPAGYMAAAGAVYAAAIMIYNAYHHHGVIDTGVIIAAFGAVASLLTRQVVTPVGDPRDGCGNQLVPAPPLPADSGARVVLDPPGGVKD